MSLCQSIDTLAMALLDDELVAEEKRELELHLLSCASCRARVDSERAELEHLRKVLLPPPAPDMLKARLHRALDQEDREAARAVRQRSLSFLGQWFLPGAATIASVAAIVLFVALRPPDPQVVGTVAKDAVRLQTKRTLPMEVQGASTGPWLRKYYEPSVEPPQFYNPGIELVGARLVMLGSHEAAMVTYVVTIGSNQYDLAAFVIANVRGEALSGGQPILVGGRKLYVHDADGIPAVTYIDEHRMGYAITAPRLSPQELLELVVSSDLITRAQQGR